jgi:hypothetical protein
MGTTIEPAMFRPARQGARAHLPLLAGARASMETLPVPRQVPHPCPALTANGQRQRPTVIGTLRSSLRPPALDALPESFPKRRVCCSEMPAEVAGADPNQALWALRQRSRSLGGPRGMRLLGLESDPLGMRLRQMALELRSSEPTLALRTHGQSVLRMELRDVLCERHGHDGHTTVRTPHNR